MPFELMASFLLMADAPGVPKPIKLEAQHQPFVPLDAPLSEETGARLAEWARGGSAPGFSGPSDETRVAPQVTTGGAGADNDSGAASRTGSAAPDSPKTISQSQRKRMFAIAKANGVEDTTLRAYVKAQTGQESTESLSVPDYEAIVGKLERAVEVAG